MKRFPAVLLTVLLALVVLVIVLLRHVSHLEEQLTAIQAKPAEPFHLGLGEVMGYQQRWIDKLGLAANAGNWGAAAFYADELKETADDIIAARVVRENQDIGSLVKSALVPAIDGVTDAVARKSPAIFATRYASLVVACNTCHAGARVPFIHVTTSDAAGARWNQVFAPADVQK